MVVAIAPHNPVALVGNRLNVVRSERGVRGEERAPLWPTGLSLDCLRCTDEHASRFRIERGQILGETAHLLGKGKPFLRVRLAVRVVHLLIP